MKRYCVLLLSVFMGGAALAQTMPQDNWRYDNLSFTGPDTNVVKRCIAVGAGKVYVSQEETPQTVVEFLEDGTFVRKFGAFGYVLGIGVDQAGNAYVVDRTNSSVKVYSPEGVFLRDWGSEGTANGQFRFKTPENNPIDGSCFVTVSADGQVYVCDPGNARIQVFNTSGVWLRTVGSLGVLPGQFAQNNPLAVGVSANGTLYAFGNATTPPRLQLFDAQGNYLRGTAAINDVINYRTASFSVAPDGVFYLRYCYNYDRDLFLDERFSQVSSYSNSSTTTGLIYQAASNYLRSAFNARGDLYVVVGKAVQVCEREYSSTHNPLTPTAVPLPSVTATAQRPGASWLDVDYRVEDADSPTVEAAAIAFIDEGNDLGAVVPIRTLVDGTENRLGPDQPTGVNRRFTWNMAADWSVDFGRIQVEVLAKDDRSLLGVHWIRIPASDVGPQLEVSRKPVDENELRTLWYWLLATGDAGVALTGGKVYGTDGLFAGVLLADNATWSDSQGSYTTRTSALGREYLYRKLGFRPICLDEIARVNAGRYGFVAVNQNSIVCEPRTGTEEQIRAWGSDGSYRVSGIGIAAFGAYSALEAGRSHSLALGESGALIGWGSNGNGELGDGTTTSRSNPVLVDANVAVVAGGGQSGYPGYSLFVKTDGTLWAMGYNAEGQLGDGTTTQRTTPVQVASNVTAVAAGGRHSLFVKTDGTLWAMGSNSNGQLGDGTTTSRSTPVQVASGVSAVTAGDQHSLFVKTDGTLWAMGYNSSGQLGDGTTTNRSAPVQVGTGVVAVAAGSGHSLFIKADGTLWAMGYNNYGQLGDGTTTNRSTPVQVGTGVVAVAAGESHTLAIFEPTSP